ncbi:MAG TPA: putative glycolipid-binding domain-containing protein [Thermoanaerobaculia bacterium]|jgi:hypothetical protein|nr:putative glycolipid-binding domain-containing protein [Thermoanaerobaculia bacterium]
MTLPRQDDAPPGAASGRRAGSRLIRALLWRRVDIAGIEYFRLWESAAGPRLTGTVVMADAGIPLRLKYAVACAPDWTSRGVHVALTRGAVTRHLKLTAGDGQRWWRSAEEAPRSGAGPPREAAREAARAGAGGASGATSGSPRPVPAAIEIPAVAGCLDVDLAFTPATNILPLRRLRLAVGESREMTAAWVRFPELSVEPLAQRYTRLDERRVRYESRGGAFTAELEVDELGLVVSYPPLWERVAAGSSPEGEP